MPYPSTGAIVRLACDDRRGIVAAFLSAQGLTIHESQQYGDEDTGRFFMRVDARSEGSNDLGYLRAAFSALSNEFGMTWQIVDREYRPRLMVMVSKQEHCLADLLYRQRTGSLSGEVVAVVSNHTDLRHLADWHDLPFHHLPRMICAN
jgi:formyltetrahydrofolate deformylase